jgi:hypothetical protein
LDRGDRAALWLFHIVCCFAFFAIENPSLQKARRQMNSFNLLIAFSAIDSAVFDARVVGVVPIQIGHLHVEFSDGSVD